MFYIHKIIYSEVGIILPIFKKRVKTQGVSLCLAQAVKSTN